MPYDATLWQVHQNFNFAEATDAQKEVLARENTHCSKTFQALSFPLAHAVEYRGAVWSIPNSGSWSEYWSVSKRVAGR